MKLKATVTRTGYKALMFLALVGVSAVLMADGELNGKWQTGEDNSVVEVTESDGVAVGKLISSDNPKATLGTEILRDVSQADGVWKGTIYAVKRDKLMPATITPSADSLQIKVSAGFLSQNVTWTRVTE